MVGGIQAQLVDFEHGQGLAGDRSGDAAVRAHLRVVAHALQQAIGHARRAAAAPRDFFGTVPFDRYLQDAGGARHDLHQRRGVVILQVVVHAEAVAQRRGDQAKASGRADHREALQAHAQRARAGPLADDKVHRVIFHRRVERLLDDAIEPVNLVDEEDIARLLVGQDSHQVSGPLEGRARRDADVDAHLGGDHTGQRGLAKPRWPVQKDVIQRLAPLFRGIQQDAQILLHLGLADIFGEAARPQAELGRILLLLAPCHDAIGHAGTSWASAAASTAGSTLPPESTSTIGPSAAPASITRSNTPATQTAAEPSIARCSSISVCLMAGNSATSGTSLTAMSSCRQRRMLASVVSPASPSASVGSRVTGTRWPASRASNMALVLLLWRPMTWGRRLWVLAAAPMPAIRPPPPTGATSSPASGHSSSISCATVPWPAMTSGCSNAWMYTAPVRSHSSSA